MTNETAQPTNVGSNEGLGVNRERAVHGLQALRVVLGIDSPETRGWAPMVQQEARRAIDRAIATLSARVAVAALAVEWDQDSGAQWTDRHYGFSIMEEQGDELPFCAAWGEGDAEQFATLAEAQAWCQAQVDRWIAKYAVLTPNV